MSLDQAVRAMEILISVALIFQCLEHLLLGRDSFFLQILKIGLCVLLILNVGPQFAVPALFAAGVYQLKIYQGPYNGGSDRMALLVLLVLGVARWASVKIYAEFAVAYLALQLVLSYFTAGMAKLRSPDWFSGATLEGIFLKSNYVTERWRAFGKKPALLKKVALGILAFEILFPLCLFHRTAFVAAMCLALAFHIANGIVLGLNRFIWTWLAAYPALIWFMGRFDG